MKMMSEGRFVVVEITFKEGKEPISDYTTVSIGSIPEMFKEEFDDIPYEDTLLGWGKTHSEGKMLIVMSHDKAIQISKALVGAAEVCRELMEKGGDVEEVSRRVKARYNT